MAHQRYEIWQERIAGNDISHTIISAAHFAAFPGEGSPPTLTIISASRTATEARARWPGTRCAFALPGRARSFHFLDAAIVHIVALSSGMRAPPPTGSWRLPASPRAHIVQRYHYYALVKFVRGHQRAHGNAEAPGTSSRRRRAAHALADYRGPHTMRGHDDAGAMARCLPARLLIGRKTHIITITALELHATLSSWLIVGKAGRAVARIAMPCYYYYYTGHIQIRCIADYAPLDLQAFMEDFLDHAMRARRLRFGRAREAPAHATMTTPSSSPYRHIIVDDRRKVRLRASRAHAFLYFSRACAPMASPFEKLDDRRAIQFRQDIRSRRRLLRLYSAFRAFHTIRRLWRLFFIQASRRPLMLMSMLHFLRAPHVDSS